MNKKLFFSSMIAISLLVACAPAPEPAEIVIEKAQARWDALVERDFAVAYEYTTPGFRERTQVEDYRLDMMRRPLRWESAQVQQVECEEMRCSVEILVGYRVPVGPTGIRNMQNQRPVRENWIEVDGDWWFVATE